MEPHLSPAPWTTDSECGDESVLDADGFMVADCAIFSLQGGERSNVANARAIAALPALLGYVRAAADAGCGKATSLLSAIAMEAAKPLRREAGSTEGDSAGPQDIAQKGYPNEQ